MATVLQQQLAAIAANSTHQLDLKAQKALHSKSLLFDARDAASQNFDTIYQLCLEGFEELCQLDSRFVPFSRNLFSEQSKNEDRTQMTAKENAELDGVIGRFLGLLGGRLLLKPAMKAAEWLVRRFRVHEYNTESVLLTFLPYHASHIFPTLLSILPSQLPSNFRFLHPYVTSLQSPPRHAIVAAASNNSAFFTAFSQYVLNVAKARHQSALLLGFWASVAAQAVNGMIDSTRSGRETIRRQKEEDLLLKVLPILQTALSIKGVPELYLGSCMIMTILATKSSLSDKALNAMMEAVAAGWTEQTVEDGMICLAVLAEEKHEPVLPKSVTRAIMKQDDSLKTMRRIGSKCRVERLLTGASLSALRLIVAKQDSQAVQLVTEALTMDELSVNSKIDVLVGAMREAGSDSDPEDNGDARHHILSILSSVAEQEDNRNLVKLASQRADVNISRFDAGLALQLQNEPADDEEEDSDPMMLDDKPAEEGSRSSLDLETLPKLPSKQTSFLDPKHQQLFAEYAAAFRKALPSRDDLDALLTTQSLDKSSWTNQPTVLTFFAAIWTSDMPASVRLKALQIASELLQQAKVDEQSMDMQALLPYIISALADPAKAVRSAAASLCLASNALFKAKSGNPATWSKDTIYGKHSSAVQWMSPADAHRFVSEALLPVLEDCIVDSNYIAQSLADTINAPSSTTKQDRKEMKAALRTAAYAFLASHVVSSPSKALQLHLLGILSKVGKAAGPSRAHILLPYIRHVVNDKAAEIENAELYRALIGSITHRSADEIQLLKDLASGQISRQTKMHVLAFGRIRHLWPSMKDAAQVDVVDWLLSLVLNANAEEDIQSEAVETIRGLSLSTDVLVHLVESLPSVNELQGQTTPAKRQRTSRTSETSKPGSVDKVKINNAIHRMTMVLELVEESAPEKHPQLLKGLFHILGELHHYKTLVDSELVYLQGLLVNSLLSVVNGLKASSNTDVDRSVIRADLIVDCVRTTSSTQVHYAALLLMSALASWAPDLVLHSVMPLFTFMSSTILKHSDDYSAHVTDQTVARIIPPLAASLKKRGRDLISGAAELLLSFTAAFEHIPLHRRSGLFRHLVATLGAEESLFAIAAMLIERYPDEPNLRPFVAELMGQFPVKVQLTAVKQYLDLMFDTLKPKRVLSDVILGFGEKNADQMKESTSTLLNGLADALARDTLRKRLAKELKNGGEDSDGLRVTYSIILEKTMQLDLQVKSDKKLHASASELLTSVLGLMPTKDFIDSSAMLMQSGTNEIRQQVFYSLEQRVSTAKRGDAELQRVFIDVLPNCGIFIAKSQPIETRLAAIACIDRISERFGKTDRAAVMSAARQIAGDAALGGDDSGLRRMSLLCLASMVEVLGDEVIPILPTVLEKALGYMEEIVDDDDEEDLFSAGFSLALAILDHIPWMLTGTYLDRLLKLAASSDVDEAQQVRELTARKVAAHDCFTAIERTWEDLVASEDSSIHYVVSMFHAAIKHQTKSTITKNAQQIFTLLLNAFDLRLKLASRDESVDNDSVFSEVDETAMEVVLKLNDSAFRPFFVRFVEWATTGLPKNNQRGHVKRCQSLYSFSLLLFDQLKSLVTSYAGFLLDNAASLLKTMNAQDADQVHLLELVAKTLASSFANDQDGFWQSPAHFDVIVEPLLGLLKMSHESLVHEYAIPAIAELAGAATSPEHHKSLNSIIMSNMRHEDAHVRLAAVKCERAITEKLNVDWIGLLPEWLPFISELQEDDDGPVERETLRWMKQIEDVTGESLDNHHLRQKSRPSKDMGQEDTTWLVESNLKQMWTDFVSAINARDLSLDSPVWQNLSPHFSYESDAAAPERTGLSSRENSPASYLASLRRITEICPGYRQHVKNYCTEVMPKAGFAEMAIDIDVYGLFEGLVRPHVTHAEFRVKEGKWYCTRAEAVSGEAIADGTTGGLVWPEPRDGYQSDRLKSDYQSEREG